MTMATLATVSDIIQQQTFFSTYLEPLMPYAELCYYICGIFILIVAFLGLRQIKIAKQTFHINSTREGLKLTAEQCKMYADEIIPVWKDIYKDIKDNVFLKSWEFKSDNQKFELVFTGNEDDVKKLVIPDNLSLLLNKIEAFSLFFACRIANEKAAFLCLGLAHVDIIKKVLPIIMPMYQKGYFKNTMFLFSLWSQRIEQEKLLNKKYEIEKMLKKSNKIDLSVIGTEPSCDNI